MNADTRKNKVGKKMRGFHDGCLVVEGHHFHAALDFRCLRCGIDVDDAVYEGESGLAFRPCKPSLGDTSEF